MSLDSGAKEGFSQEVLVKLGREERRKSPRQLELLVKGPEWERRADRCGQNTEKEGSRELGLARWGHNRGWSHTSLTPTPVPSPCHPASPVSLILVPDAFEVWAQPGLGAGETGPCKQFPTAWSPRAVMAGAGLSLWEGTLGEVGE